MSLKRQWRVWKQWRNNINCENKGCRSF